MPTQNIAILLSYMGGAYHGWQAQANAHTVQAEVEAALEMLTQEKITLYGCGRTDAGVHARNFVANFRSGTKIPMHRLPLALNSRLPRDIACSDAKIVPDDFHARYSCKKKRYVYRILTGPIRDPFLEAISYHYPYALDAALMDRCAKHYEGTRDFRAFLATGSPVKSTVRTVFEASVVESNGLVEFCVTGDGFLYNMVRIMAGTLVYVSRGKIDPDDIPAILESGRRVDAGVTLPPQGLTLDRVWYDDVDFAYK